MFDSKVIGDFWRHRQWNKKWSGNNKKNWFKTLAFIAYSSDDDGSINSQKKHTHITISVVKRGIKIVELSPSGDFFSLLLFFIFTVRSFEIVFYSSFLPIYLYTKMCRTTINIIMVDIYSGGMFLSINNKSWEHFFFYIINPIRIQTFIFT